MRLPLLALDAAAISAGDTAWVLTSTALVMVMTVGLAFFYGGLVRPKNALNTIDRKSTRLNSSHVAISYAVFCLKKKKKTKKKATQNSYYTRCGQNIRQHR